MVARQIVGGVSAFAEIAFASRGQRDARDEVALTGGIVLVVTKDLALDAAVGTSLAGSGPDYAFTVGRSCDAR